MFFITTADTSRSGDMYLKIMDEVVFKKRGKVGTIDDVLKI